MYIADRAYEVRSGELADGSKEEMESATLFKEGKKELNKVGTALYTDTLYDLVGEIEQRTHLTRKTIVNILKEIKEEKFLLVRKNPEEFITKCSKFINEVKASLVINNIAYHKTDEVYDAKTVFTNDKNAIRNTELLKKHIYDFISTDSKEELKFVSALETSVEIIVYAKFPRSFSIPTPVGNFNPDWAIVFDKDKVRHIYFVVETKGSNSDQDLREIEKLKIHCASQHFAEISGNEVTFTKASSYETLMSVVSLN